MSRFGTRCSLAIAPGVVVFTLWACDQSAPSRSVVARASATATPSPPSRARVPPEPPASPKPAMPLAAAEIDDRPVTASRFVIDDLNDVGPAAPASAYAEGVVLITRSDELSLARLSQAPSQSKKPAAGRIEASRRGPADFWPVARGPAVSGTHAYWVSKGRVVRRAFAGGDLEVLAADAREGTRVAVAGTPDAVAYVTQPADKADSRAKLRLADGRSLVLTPEGSAASSVSLARSGDGLIASFIDGRSGMTPVHARRVRSVTGQLEPDVVVWVAGATQGMTEIASVGHGDTTWLIMPVEKDARHFGLATLALLGEPKMDPPLRWRTYENGLDRAPAAAAVVCGTPVAVYVRPADEKPQANQELVIAELTIGETAGSEVLASARGFADVSIHPVAAGAVLAYVADRRTWARLLRCK